MKEPREVMGRWKKREKKKKSTDWATWAARRAGWWWACGASWRAPCPCRLGPTCPCRRTTRPCPRSCRTRGSATSTAPASAATSRPDSNANLSDIISFFFTFSNSDRLQKQSRPWETTVSQKVSEIKKLKNPNRLPGFCSIFLTMWPCFRRFR